MDTSEKLLALVTSTFDEPEVQGVALWLTSSMAVVEAAQAGMVGRKEFVQNLPPHTIDLMYRYDSALVNNDFFLKHFAVLKSVSILDKIKAMAVIKLSIEGENTNSRRAFEATKQVLLSKFDSLILLAFIWKGYEFGIEFACKLHMVVDLMPGQREYFKGKI